MFIFFLKKDIVLRSADVAFESNHTTQTHRHTHAHIMSMSTSTSMLDVKMMSLFSFIIYPDSSSSFPSKKAI